MSGLIVTLGLASGLIVHTTAAAFGVAVLFQTSQAAFAMLKYAGAGYLVYLAWKAFTATETRLDSADAPRIATRKLFLRGLIMNIANPKVTIFMLAFLPQFVDPNNGPIIGQFYQLGALMFLATVVVFGAVALAAGTLGGLLRGSPGVQLWLNRISGVIFVALALKLATAER
jgi:threonine/homoserine/homoserine lactone efflux protein